VSSHPKPGESASDNAAFDPHQTDPRRLSAEEIHAAIEKRLAMLSKDGETEPTNGPKQGIK
jgi:hypothetical protein